MCCQECTCRGSSDQTWSSSCFPTSPPRESGLCTHPVTHCHCDLPSSSLFSSSTTFPPSFILYTLPHPLLSNRVCVVCQRFSGKTEETEKWYGTHFSHRKISPETISQWENVAHSDQLHLPPVNEFIPTNFDLLTPPEGAQRHPVLVQVRVIIPWPASESSRMFSGL